MRTLILTMVLVGLMAIPGAQKQRQKTTAQPETEYQQLKRLRQVFQQSVTPDRDKVLRVIDYRLMLMETPGFIPWEDRPGMTVRSDERSSDAFRVDQVVDKKTFIGITFANNLWHYSLVKGISTEGFVDDRIPLIPPGMFFRVSSVKRSGRTMLQYEVVPAPEPPKADEQLAFEEALKSLRLPTPPKPTVDREKAAAARLGIIRQLLAVGDRSTAVYQLRKLLREDADTKAAIEAEKLLKIVEKD